MAEPVISYPGAKWRFWEHIKPYIPKDIKDWREPFFGGGSMSLSIADDPDFNLERMIVGDLAPEIWAMWTGIRDYAPEVRGIAIEWFNKWCPGHAEIAVMNKNDIGYEETYNRAVDEARKFWEWAETVDCSTLSIPERAARTYLVNKISFSGMGDSGSLSKDRFEAFNPEKHTLRITAAQHLLQKMEIKNCSFEETMADVDPNKTFIFLDPPYYRQESSGLYGRGGDTHHGFPHDHFAEFTKNTNCKWFVTYDDSVKVRRMFRGTSVYGEILLTPFKIPGGYTMSKQNSIDALDGEELFITNYDIHNIDIDSDLGMI
jgi:DNA adenine methylase